MSDEDDPNIIWQRAFDHFLSDWITPEIRRRQAASILPVPVNVQKFQIIWYPPPREREIRINDEVRAELEIKMRDGVLKTVGEDVFMDDIESVKNIRMCGDEDQDCGHVTGFRLRDRWICSFDAIYNKGLAAKYLTRGDEFMAVARHSLGSGMLNAFVDNLFSASELYAKARLLLLAEFEFRGKTNHRNAAARLNFHASLGNVALDQKDAFNELSRLRYPARYVDQGDVILEASKAADLLSAVESMREVIVMLIEARSR